MHPTLSSRYAVIGWCMVYFCHAWQKRATASYNNPRFFSSVQWGNTVQRFSIGINDVWDYCITANGDRVTFTELLVTTTPFLLQEPFLSDRPKSTRSFLGRMTLLTGSSLSVSESVLLPSSKSDTVLFYVFSVCVVCWLLYWGTALQARGRVFDSRWGTSSRTMALESTQPLTEMSTMGISWGLVA
jgi:hypothetical protein